MCRDGAREQEEGSVAALPGPGQGAVYTRVSLSGPLLYSSVVCSTDMPDPVVAKAGEGEREVGGGLHHPCPHQAGQGGHLDRSLNLLQR